MAKSEDGADSAAGPRHGLGPHVVGQRVVVRRIVPGETGPSGGPAMTDVLGVCEAWGDGEALIRTADGEAVTIRTALIVSGKPVPPRPSRFARLSVDEVERRCAALFRPAAVEHVGDWVLRYTGGTNGRPNSILPIGDPGVPVGEAIRIATSFYERHGRRPCAQVVVGSEVQGALTDLGWVRLRPDEADTEVLLAGVAQLSRALAGVPTDEVVHEPAITHDWLVGNTSAQENFRAVAASLALDDVVFASVARDGVQVARARTNLVDDWAFFADLTVQPEHRRQGLARMMTAALTEWSAERGASVMALQVVADNVDAQSLYADLGFERHHAYRYLTPPG